MRAIIIGAGRGQRLMPTTAHGPKCFAEVQGKRILDWIVEALRQGGVDEICFVGGYRIDDVRRHYPDLTFRTNENWSGNNILASLMYAEDLMDGPFVACYSDILFTGDIVRRLLQAPGEIVLGVDEDWREHYRLRTQHPPTDAEKVITRGPIVERVERAIPTEQATGEFIGVSRFSQRGAALLREHFHRNRRLHGGGPFREAAVFEKAYLIQLLQDMIENGVEVGHVVDNGQYREIDTQEDMALAQMHWKAGE